jgi:biotin carboxyl carrier protein
VSATVAKPAASGSETVVSSPLPGVILEVSVKEGDSVKRGQKLMILEAMKMENVIEASADGKIVSIKANKGDSVLEGAPLIIIG